MLCVGCICSWVRCCVWGAHAHGSDAVCGVHMLMGPMLCVGCTCSWVRCCVWGAHAHGSDAACVFSAVHVCVCPCLIILDNVMFSSFLTSHKIDIFNSCAASHCFMKTGLAAYDLTDNPVGRISCL